MTARRLLGVRVLERELEQAIQLRVLSSSGPTGSLSEHYYRTASQVPWLDSNERHRAGRRIDEGTYPDWQTYHAAGPLWREFRIQHWIPSLLVLGSDSSVPAHPSPCLHVGHSDGGVLSLCRDAFVRRAQHEERLQ